MSLVSSKNPNRGGADKIVRSPGSRVTRREHVFCVFATAVRVTFRTIVFNLGFGSSLFSKSLGNVLIIHFPTRPCNVTRREDSVLFLVSRCQFFCNRCFLPSHCWTSRASQMVFVLFFLFRVHFSPQSRLLKRLI